MVVVRVKDGLSLADVAESLKEAGATRASIVEFTRILYVEGMTVEQAKVVDGVMKAGSNFKELT
jgi:hypothetical protein